MPATRRWPIWGFVALGCTGCSSAEPAVDVARLDTKSSATVANVFRDVVHVHVPAHAKAASASPAGSLPHTLYLNGYGTRAIAGATLFTGEDARQNLSKIVGDEFGNATRTIPSFAQGSANWSLVLGCVQEGLRQYAVTVTDTRPASSTEYIMAMVGGRCTDWSKCSDDVLGQAELNVGGPDYSPIDFVAEIDRWTGLPLPWTSICSSVLHEVGHSYGLQHPHDYPQDLMATCVPNTFARPQYQEHVSTTCDDDHCNEVACDADPTRSGVDSATQLVDVVGGSGFQWSDVPVGSTFYYYIQANSEFGYTRGWPFPDNSYHPNDDMRRQEFMELAVNGTEHSARSTIQRFTDVPDSNPYSIYVNTAFDLGIVSGCGVGSFCPADPLKRAQATKIVVTAMGWPLVYPTTPSFTDVPRARGYPYQYVETAVAHGLVGGYGDGTFRPWNNVTRGQANKIVYNAWATRPHNR